MTDSSNRSPLTVWLTGATSGIGEAVLIKLAERGDHVLATGRNREKLDELSSRYPGYVTPLPGDVTDPLDVSRLQAELDQHTPIHWAILNAGTCEYMDVSDYDAELVSRVMNTNVVGAARSVGAVLPALRASRDTSCRPLLAVVSSSAWWFPFTRAEAYGASKAALTYFAESLRADLDAEGIDVSVVSPGFVKTPLTDQNDFEMPFLISAEQAAEIMVRNLDRHRADIHFPKRFTVSLKLLGLLPRSLRDRMAAAMSRNQAAQN